MKIYANANTWHLQTHLIYVRFFYIVYSLYIFFFPVLVQKLKLKSSWNPFHLQQGPLLYLSDIRLPGKGNSNSHGARPVYKNISIIKWIRTSRLSIKNSLSLHGGVFQLMFLKLTVNLCIPLWPSGWASITTPSHSCVRARSTRGSSRMACATARDARYRVRFCTRKWCFVSVFVPENSVSCPICTTERQVSPHPLLV